MPAITAISKANPAVVESTGHGLTTGAMVYLYGVTGMTEVNERSFTITRVDDDNYSLDGEDSTSHSTFTAGNWTEGPLLWQLGIEYTSQPTLWQLGIEYTSQPTLWQLGVEYDADVDYLDADIPAITASFTGTVQPQAGWQSYTNIAFGVPLAAEPEGGLPGGGRPERLPQPQQRFRNGRWLLFLLADEA